MIGRLYGGTWERKNRASIFLNYLMTKSNVHTTLPYSYITISGTCHLNVVWNQPDAKLCYIYYNVPVRSSL